MKIGLYATGSATSSHADLAEQVEYADRVGFDSVWLRERHFHCDHQGRNFFTSPLVVAAHLAARTRRIRIGVGARILPLDHPIRIAEDAATVDVLSGGRLDLGVARIGENELYQRAFGTSGEEARGRFEEALEILLEAWTGKPFSYAGSHYDVPEVAVNPRPLQRPHPPVYLVGISHETLRFGAGRGFPLLLAGAQTAPMLRQTQESYYALLEEAGHSREDVVLPVNRFVYVADTDRQAIRDTKDAIEAFIHRGASVIRDFLPLPEEQVTYELLFNEICIFGDPDYCLGRIEELADSVDLRHLILSFNYFTLEHDKCLRSMSRFVEHVMPRLRDRPALAFDAEAAG